MKRTRIDFAPRSLRRILFLTPPRVFALAVVALSLCTVAAISVERYLEQQRELQALQAALAARSSAPVKKVAATPAPKLAPAQAKAVNDAVMQLNLPWRDLHDAVHAATPANVALLSLEPDAKRRTLRISAEARNSDDMLAYVGKMQAQDWFSSVVLTRHEVAEQDPNRPIRFQISAQWGTP
jgi:Tfp pilus assembly protein PilN